MNLGIKYVGEDPEQFDKDADLALEAEVSVSRPLLVQQFTESAREQLTGFVTPDNTEELDGIVKQKVDEQLAVLEATGLLIEKDDRLSLALLYQGGESKVNGKPMDIGILKGLLGGL